MRIAWFSPLPPVRTGIADASAELVAALRTRGHDIDPYPDAAAHDFPWTHRQRAYDLIVYQFGNSSHHDYQWAYALRYPGLVVLHDTHLHHARAAFLLRERRAADYRAEFAWNHPDVPADAAELAIAGFDSQLFYRWPMVRSLIDASRLVAVHGEATRAQLLDSIPDAAGKVVSVRLGHGQFVSPDQRQESRRRIRATLGIADDEVVFGLFGGLTPEKRIPQVLAAMRALAPYAPTARLLLAGAAAAHYDVHAGIAAHGLQARVIVTGYLEESALTAHLAACDVSLNLRWPTARETSGAWLRALAAGVPTIITDLAHLGDVPSLDPRTWQEDRLWALGVGLWDETTETTEVLKPAPLKPLKPKAQSPKPVSIAIDILDEDHSLRLAMRRLAQDAELRERLGRAGQAWWQREHSLEQMVDDYERVLAAAASRPGNAPDAADGAPPHLRSDGDRRLHALLAPFGIEAPI
jgi:glycosyltransferase involved in cell wall biosynthesis